MFLSGKKQRWGILGFIGVVLLIQLSYTLFSKKNIISKPSVQEEQWLTNQIRIDSLKKTKKTPYKIKPFNPNYISDFTGYRLGMSVDEIDRLHKFRQLGQYVNSAEDFKKVTQISDSLLAVLVPYFKFPAWINNSKSNSKNSKFHTYPKAIIPIKELNEATTEDIIKIHGIGPILSERILKCREQFGALVTIDQLEDFLKLSPEVIEQLHQHFTTQNLSRIKKIKINEWGIRELSEFPYFKSPVARNIVVYRSMNGDFKKIDDLIEVKDFPVDKIKIIGLYLDF